MMSEQQELEQTKRVLAWYKLQQEIRSRKAATPQSKKVKNEKVG